MCLAVYIASDHTLPLVEWNEKEPKFNVVPINKSEKIVKKQFNLPNIVYAGSHVGCGCGFFKDGEVGEELAQVQATYDALVSYLQDLISQGADIEIFSCWEGDQSTKPEFKEKLSLEALGADEFEFKEKAYYEIS
ncbi:MAG: hypothetical protein KZQ90_20560 [Candidatus Thiodiazotropha sp. (ex Codakia rugifera)]|nr:hypothetical protein [Candidatus Thiodiazotropha sp. (ex Codakia rugifera)]